MDEQELPPLDTAEQRHAFSCQELLPRLKLSDDEKASLRACRQKSIEWFQARSHRLTASNFGSAAGHNRHCSPQQLLKRMLWPADSAEDSFRNAAMQWGVDHEAHAVQEYKYRRGIETNMTVHILHYGILLNDQYPWIGVSPDGIVLETNTSTGETSRGLLEIKCPYSMKIYDQIPPFYYDQIQGSMGFLGLQWCDFVVWTPAKMETTRYDFNSDYFHETLYPALEMFWFCEYAPRVAMKERGVLEEGELSVPLLISAAAPTASKQPSISSTTTTSNTFAPTTQGIKRSNDDDEDEQDESDMISYHHKRIKMDWSNGTEDCGENGDDNLDAGINNACYYDDTTKSVFVAQSALPFSFE